MSAEQHLDSLDEVASSSSSSLLVARRPPWTSPGWRPPTEDTLQPGSSSSWIGGGPIGGVPERNRPATPAELSALGSQVWSKAGGYPVEGLEKAKLGGGESSSHGSSSWSPSTSPGEGSSSSGSSENSSMIDPNQYDLSRTRAFTCRALSECEPCPPQTRGHPFCRPYGNRRMVACRAVYDGVSAVGGGTSGTGLSRREEQDDFTKMMRDPGGAEGIQVISAASGLRAPPGQQQNNLPQLPSDVDLIGWEACGKVVRNETRDYLEFVMILVLLALFSLQMLIRRNRQLWEKVHFEGSPSSDNGAGEGGSGRLRTGDGQRRARRTKAVRRAR
ncbi:hypothetical protein BDZ90DRAFT_277177 [Jaminaea rosea]|uniref:Uncharacterized protein n=1 Tax=Jaminaea rosea TaxID=1569628 RepID=A0A316UZT9_9BASI|nr:hypothetical protein BDZ90DRAFT_277177 [Jaminaea rosea]PWN30742.1 hypothetical protein BDZ90DRAFT_277177 [Jaminaea rosea]